MTLVVPWLVVPLMLVALCLGCGLLAEAVSGSEIGAVMLLPVGLAVVVAIGALTVSTPATAKLTTPLVVALAAAGVVVKRLRPRREDSWGFGAAAATYACYGAPVLASGSATFAGYIKLDDTATFLALSDRILDHGRSLAGLAPSSYEATLSVNLSHGYPLGSLIPLAISHQLARTDSAWLWQPWLSFCAAVVALCLYQLASPLVPHRAVRSLVAFTAAQSALLLGYALWGGVKELAATALIGTAAATAPAKPSTMRQLLPFAIACAAVLDTLSIAGAVWLVPLALPLVVVVRRAPAVVAAGVAAAVVLAVPALATAADFLSGTNLSTFENGVVLGNLARPLQPLQIMGIWPNGDFRVEPRAATASALLVALAVAAAVAGVLLAFARRSWPLLLATASALAGAVVFETFGAPWLGAKALAVGSPFVLLIALCGCFAFLGHRRPAVLVAAAAAGLVLVTGVAWSDALAYHDVDLAPRGQLRELEWIGSRFAGDGPALMTEYQPYGVRHFLRRLDAEGASELRRRPVLLRNGRLAGKGEYVDLDQIQPSALLVYRTLVLRRSPTESRPPAPYRLVWRGRWYEVWQRQVAARVPVEHLALGNALQAAGVPRCASVRELATRGHLVVAPRPLNLVWSLDSATLPAGWSPTLGGAILPSRSGTLRLHVLLRHTDRYRLWVGGSIRGTLTASIDGSRVGSASTQLQNAGQWLDLGATKLRAGTHTISLTASFGVLAPGTGGGGFPLGPLLLQPETNEELMRPSRPASACGRSLDWLEVLPY